MKDFSGSDTTFNFTDTVLEVSNQSMSVFIPKEVILQIYRIWVFPEIYKDVLDDLR